MKRFPCVIQALLGLSVFLIIAALSGCDSPTAPENTLVIALESSPTNLDPRMALDAASVRLNQLIYSKLVRFDHESNIISDLAESWETPDSTTYVFHLKKGVLFHDGEEVTSEDVKYTFESILDPALGSAKRGSYLSLESIEAPHPRTVVFKLKRPYAPFMVSMIQGIVPRHIVSKEDDSLSRRPIGSGPFRFVRWERGDKVVLKAYDGYFAGKPKLDSLVFRIVPDETIRLLELEKGGVHLLQNSLSPDMLPRVRKNPKLKIVSGPSVGYSYLGFNTEDPILKHKEVRMAIAYAINRATIIKNIFKGMASPASGLLPPEHWAYEGEVALYGYQKAKAVDLLNRAGFTDPDGGGPELRFRLIYKTSQNQLRRRIAEVIQQQLAEVGIKLEIQSYEWGTFFSHIRNGNFQLYSLSWVGITEPDIYYYIFHSSSFPPDGANRGKYLNPEIDSLLEQGRQTTDHALRKDIYNRIQKIIASDVPYVSLWHEMNVAVMQAEVEGFILYPGGDFTSLKNVFFNKQ